MSPTPHTPKVTVPAPTAFTLRLRTFLPWQVIRFVWINVKMLRMIVLSAPRHVRHAAEGSTRP